MRSNLSLYLRSTSRYQSRPELADIRSLLSRLWNVTCVYGNGFSNAFSKSLPHKKEIELHPVKLTFEQLPEALFRAVRVTAHLGEINLSCAAYYTNYSKWLHFCGWLYKARTRFTYPQVLVLLYYFNPHLAIRFALQNRMTEFHLKIPPFPKALQRVEDTLAGTFTE